MDQVITIDKTIKEETLDEPKLPEILETPKRAPSPITSHTDFLVFIEKFGEELGFNPLHITSPSPEDIAMCISRKIIPPCSRTCPSAPKPPYISTFGQIPDQETQIRPENILYAENWPNDAALHEAGFPLRNKRGLGIDVNIFQCNTLVTGVHPHPVEFQLESLVGLGLAA